MVGNVSYHNYKGIITEADQRKELIKDLGVHNKVVLLRNHGALCCGETVEEAFFYAKNLVAACESQVKLSII